MESLSWHGRKVMPGNYDSIRKENIREYGEGKRHLDFLGGQLYSDHTHFVYELLQNAEDKDARRIQILLYRDRLEFLHDGTPFDEADIGGICGVGAGTKSEDPTRIGKFGIGFKSVYAYTSSPEIHCGDEHFRIEDYVRPYAVEAAQVSTPWTTKFVLPFNKPSVPADKAFAQIAARLDALNVRTLLFLRSIEEIEWKTGEGKSGKSGSYMRASIPQEVSRRVTVVGQRTGEEDEEESWLVFERPIIDPDGNSAKPVEIAYRLKQEKETIEPLPASPLFVFFATEKDTKLGFLIQGPYKTTPARDNILKDDPFNTRLLKQTAALVVDSLHHLKSMNLLNVSVLEAMPIQERDFPRNGLFRKIYDAVAQELRDKKLLPAEAGGYLSAHEARIGRGTGIRELLLPGQLTYLVKTADMSWRWVRSNPNQPRLFKGVAETAEAQWLSRDITEERTPELRAYLMQELKIEEITPESFARRITGKFLEKQPDTWLVELYKFLLKHEALWQAYGGMRHKPFVRLEDNSHVSAFGDDGAVAVYLPQKTIKGLRCVKQSLLADSKVQKFFSRLGVREPDVAIEVIKRVLPLYESKQAEISEEKHAAHIELIRQALHVDSVASKERLISKLRNSFFLFARNAVTGEEARRQPGGVYLRNSGLEIFLKDNPKAWFLDERYSEGEIDAFGLLGVRADPEVHRKEPDQQGYVVVEKFHSQHKRGRDGFDPGCRVEHLDFAARNPNKRRSLFIWNNIARPQKMQIRGFIEKSSRQTYDGSKTEMTPSEFGDVLLSEAWLPDNEGEFHKPGELSLRELPGGFEPDEVLASQLRMKGSDLADLALKEGFNVEHLGVLQKLISNPEMLQHVEQMVKKQELKPAFPERASSDPDRRLCAAKALAPEAPRKKFGKLSRSVRISSPVVDKAGQS